MQARSLANLLLDNTSTQGNELKLPGPKKRLGPGLPLTKKLYRIPKCKKLVLGVLLIIRCQIPTVQEHVAKNSDLEKKPTMI